MTRFEYSSYINASVETVFAFHQRPDAIELLIPRDSGRVSDALAGWWVKRELRKMFAYRHAVTRRYCEPLHS